MLYFKTPFTVDHMAGKIYDADGDLILDIRGYDVLVDEAGLNLSGDDAEKEQEDMANFVVNACNSAGDSAVLSEELSAAKLELTEALQQHVDSIEELKAAYDSDTDEYKSEILEAKTEAEKATALVGELRVQNKEFRILLKDLQTCLAGKAAPERMKKVVDKLDGMKL